MTEPQRARDFVRYYGHDPAELDRIWAELEAEDDGIEPCQMPLWPGWCGLPVGHDGDCGPKPAA